MRRFLVKSAMGEAGEEPVRPKTPEEAYRDLVVETHGPRCAAWLVGGPMPKGTAGERARQRSVRRELLAKGAIDFHLPARLTKRQVAEQYWFHLAVEYLRRTTGPWSVDVQTHRGRKVYRVRWHGTAARRWAKEGAG